MANKAIKLTNYKFHANWIKRSVNKVLAFLTPRLGVDGKVG